TFDALYQLAAQPNTTNREALFALSQAPEALSDWLERWQQHVIAGQNANRLTAMRQANPLIIPRNHRIRQAISKAQKGNLTPFYTLLNAVTKPYTDTPETRRLAAPARKSERVYRT